MDGNNYSDAEGIEEKRCCRWVQGKLQLLRSCWCYFSNYFFI